MLFVVHNITDSANLLNSDLSKINEWALQWKMTFKPDPIKAQEIIFSRKASKRNHPGLLFNNNIVNLTAIHKDLGVLFDSKLSFHKHLKSVKIFLLVFSVFIIQKVYHVMNKYV